MNPPLQLDQRKALRVIRASELFDADFYRAQLPEGAAPADPLLHYLQHGEALGLWPHPLFDPVWYAGQPGAPPMPPIGPFAHYLIDGDRLRLQPVPGFDPAYVARQLPGSRVPALAAYVRAVAAGHAVAPNPFFVPGDYLVAYPFDVPAGVDAYAHFLRHGAAEQRLPAAAFDWDWLRAQYPEARSPAQAWTNLQLDWCGRRHDPTQAQAVLAQLRHARRNVGSAAADRHWVEDDAPVHLIGPPDDAALGAVAALAQDIGRETLVLPLPDDAARAEALARRSGDAPALLFGDRAIMLCAPLAEAGAQVTLYLQGRSALLTAIIGSQRYRAMRDRVRIALPDRSLARELVVAGAPGDALFLAPGWSHRRPAPTPGAVLAVADTVAVRSRLASAAARRGLDIRIVDANAPPGDVGALYLPGAGGGVPQVALDAWAGGIPVIATPDRPDVADAIMADPTLGQTILDADPGAVFAAFATLTPPRATARAALAPARFARSLLADVLGAPSVACFVSARAGRHIVEALVHQSLPAREIHWAYPADGPDPAFAFDHGVIAMSAVSGSALMARAADCHADFVYLPTGDPIGSDHLRDGVAALIGDPDLAEIGQLWRCSALQQRLLENGLPLLAAE